MFPTPDKITLIKSNGERISDIDALVQPKMILIQDEKLPIEEGDIIEHGLPSGLIEMFTVLDRGFFSFPSPHYQVKVQKGSIDLLQKQVANTIVPKNHPINRKIFIVHGHNEDLKNDVESFLTSLNLEPIILHKQADRGKTIIEKVEHYSDVGFAIILLTGDDRGAKHRGAKHVEYLNSPNIKCSQDIEYEREYAWDRFRDALEYRARQNVIFEFGYFIAKLGRNKVAALCEDWIERPSDIDGLLYTPIDHDGAWKKKIAREIDAAGIKIDEKFL
jgi:predicted nucleotide-binding protein